MNDYVLMTDANADLWPEIIEELGIEVIPMPITLDGKDYLCYPDQREMPFHECYEIIRSGKPVSTAQVTSIAFLGYFEPFLQKGLDVLYIAFSSGLSGTYNSALMAARELKEKYPNNKVAVWDSRSASLGQGLLVYHAAQEKNAGKSLDEVIANLKLNTPHLCHWFTVADLNYLRRGGRVTGASAFVGTMLNIKPVLHIDEDGHLIPMVKARGRKNSLKELLNHMVETCENPEEQMIFIGHGDSLEDAETLANMIREKFTVKDICINYIGPVVGCHSSPGTIALFFLDSKR